MRRIAELLSHLMRRLGGRPAALTSAPDDVVSHQVTDSPDEVAAYWTDERVRGARPREQRLDPPPN